MTEQPMEKQPSILDKILDGLKDIFAPNLTALMAAGILSGIIILLKTFGVIQEGTAEEFILSRMSDAIFYFLPVLLAYSSAKVFGTNQVLAASVALFLTHPEVVMAMENIVPNSDFFGLPLRATGSYPNSVIPIIFIIWGQSYIEKICSKIIPDLVRGIFLPLLVLVGTSILGLFVLGPLGTLLGNSIGWILAFLTENVGWLVPIVMGAFGMFIVMVGGHYTLFPIVVQTIAAGGTDAIMTPGLLASNLALAGAALAVFFKTSNAAYKSYSLSAAVTASLGVSQPAVYGIALPMKKVLTAAIIGGAIGGAWAGFTDFVSYAFTNPGLASLPAFLKPDGSLDNFFNGVIVIVLSFTVAFLTVWFSPFEELSAEVINEITID